MERLTKRDTDGQAMMDCEKCKADWTGKHGKPMADCTALYCRNRLKDRLAAYEDSGCAPEEVLPKDKADEIALKLMRLADLESLCNYTRLRELAEADKDGRLVVLSCKVGDTVYRVITIKGQKPVLLETRVETLGKAADVATLWRNIRDRVLAQLALVESCDVAVDEVFFPYLTDKNGRTLYQAYATGQFMLEGSNG